MQPSEPYVPDHFTKHYNKNNGEKAVQSGGTRIEKNELLFNESTGRSRRERKMAKTRESRENTTTTVANTISVIEIILYLYALRSFTLFVLCRLNFYVILSSAAIDDSLCMCVCVGVLPRPISLFHLSTGPEPPFAFLPSPIHFCRSLKCRRRLLPVA